MTFEPEQVFAHFRIIRKLGEGGMGEVYLAEDNKLGRKVALKILQADFFDDKDKQERFYREARTAARINHSNVMGIYDIGSASVEEGGAEISYIVMEYIEGQSLRDYIIQSKGSTREQLRIAEKIARGLAEAHKLGIVHRDIKAENIIINTEGEPKILDFGLAKPLAALFKGGTDDGTVTASQDLTQEGKIIGTVTYMSPEQARGEKVDSRSDIFSFGILMYKMFSGVFPFEGTDRVSTIAKILEAPHVQIRRKAENIPAELERIIDKCLQKDPNYRYQDTRDLVVDLRSLRRQYESGISDTDSMIADREALGKTKTKSYILNLKPSVLAVIGIVAVLAVIAILSFSGGSEGPGTLHARQNALAIIGFENKTGDAELDWLESGLPEILLTDLAQSGSSSLISRNRVLDNINEDLDDLTPAEIHQKCIKSARALGATRVLGGSYFMMGDKIRIDARVEDVESGQILLGEKVVGQDPFALVDSLTQKIGLLLNLKDISGDNRDVASVTSSSPEAYEQYIRGMELYRLNQYEKGIEYFKKAVEIDPTFAMPYMRAGMSYYFMGQLGSSVPYLEKAREFSNRLPRRDREMLEFYTDAFLLSKFNDAYVKLKSFVENYPDDKEARTMYAAFQYQMTRDAVKCEAQLDTVLTIDSKYLPALENYLSLLVDQDQFDSAIQVALKVRQYYPETHVGYINLVTLYDRTGQLDKALEVGRAYLEKDASHPNMLSSMANIYIKLRQFDQAQNYAEGLKRFHGKDPYQMLDYYNIAYNIANWRGEFLKGIDFKKKRVDLALQTGDSAIIFNAYNGLVGTYEGLDFPDSALFYGKKLPEYAVRFQHFNYALLIASCDYSRREEAKQYFEIANERFKASVPSELWALGDAIGVIIDGYYNADTAKIISGYLAIAELPYQSGSGLNFEAGRLSALTGKYDDAIANLNQVVSGPYTSSSGITYLSAKYYLGRTYQETGELDKAADAYREVLKYWNEPEIETEVIADTRKRLAELQF